MWNEHNTLSLLELKYNGGSDDVTLAVALGSINVHELLRGSRNRLVNLGERGSAHEVKKALIDNVKARSGTGG